jgi:hypothetical protein
VSIYLDLLQQWPLIVAVLVTFLVVKSHFFGDKTAKAFLDAASTEMVSSAMQDAMPGRKMDEKTRSWLEKARNVNYTIMKLRNEPLRQSQPVDFERIPQLNGWQKATLGWTVAWFGITFFFILEMILDPAIWGGNWVLLPYFFYYIMLGLIIFLKR